MQKLKKISMNKEMKETAHPIMSFNLLKLFSFTNLGFHHESNDVINEKKKVFFFPFYDF